MFHLILCSFVYPFILPERVTINYLIIILSSSVRFVKMAQFRLKHVAVLNRYTPRLIKMVVLRLILILQICVIDTQEDVLCKTCYGLTPLTVFIILRNKVEIITIS